MEHSPEISRRLLLFWWFFGTFAGKYPTFRSTCSNLQKVRRIFAISSTDFPFPMCKYEYGKK